MWTNNGRYIYLNGEQVAAAIKTDALCAEEIAVNIVNTMNEAIGENYYKSAFICTREILKGSV